MQHFNCVCAAVVTTTWTQADTEPSGCSRFVPLIYNTVIYYVQWTVQNMLQVIVLLIGIVSLAIVHWRQTRIQKIVASRIEQQIRA